MAKNNLQQDEVPYPNPTVDEKIPGKNLFHAPQPALPVADETAFPFGSGSAVQAAAITTLNNMRSRIDALETALIKLGFIKHS